MDQDISTQVPHAEASSADGSSGPRAARSRLWLRVVSLVLAAVALGFVFLWLRDAHRIDQGIKRLRPYRVVLQRYLDQSDTLPSVFPEYPDTEEAQLGEGHFTYVDKDVVAWARKANEAVLIGYGPLTRLFLRNDVYPAIFYNNGELRRGWVVEGELTSTVGEQSSPAPDFDP